MHYLIIFFIGCLLFAPLHTQNNTPHNSIGFPEVDEDLNSKNKDNRRPVYLPSVCSVNELYYPGDQLDDWICDCRPAYLYYPATDSCWAAYQRGPCAVGDYLILPPNSVIPVCTKNPCHSDSYVYFKGRCETLGSISACEELFPVVAAVGVNATTLDVDCVKLNLESRFGDEKDFVEIVNVLCKPGSKTKVSGKCDKTSQ